MSDELVELRARVGRLEAQFSAVSAKLDLLIKNLALKNQEQIDVVEKLRKEPPELRENKKIKDLYEDLHEIVKVHCKRDPPGCRSGG